MYGAQRPEWPGWCTCCPPSPVKRITVLSGWASLIPNARNTTPSEPPRVLEEMPWPGRRDIARQRGRRGRERLVEESSRRLGSTRDNSSMKRAVCSGLSSRTFLSASNCALSACSLAAALASRRERAAAFLSGGQSSVEPAGQRRQRQLGIADQSSQVYRGNSWQSHRR